MPSPTNRTARIFLSSTFRDFGEERDLLVRKVFPALRARLRERFVEVVDVDLRWGITVEQAERGEVLPICLAEIDRARPWFVGMLGERYGWIPPADGYAADLLERQPWLRQHQGGRSVTELEILHGVLNDPRMAGRALFYFRSAAHARRKGGDYVPASPEDARRQRALKARIRRSRFPVIPYRDPQALAKRLERDLWKLLDAAFPADQVPDAFTRESMRHEAYAAPRRRLYLGGERYIAALDKALAAGRQRILVEGASGGGKSALLANWLERHRKAHRRDIVHVHYTGASADAADPHALVRRLCEAIRRETGGTEKIPDDPQKLMEALPLWLAHANGHAGRRRTRWVIVLDALNGITGLRDLRWWPEFLPERVHVVASCLPGAVAEALRARADRPWARIAVRPLSAGGRRDILVAYLARFNKTLPRPMLRRALAHPLASNPLFLRTLAEELRLFGVHEELEARLGECLASRTIDDLFERVLARVEADCGRKPVRATMTAIWASRAGLTEEEILAIAGLVPATWAPIRNALDDGLLESGGRIGFAHDYLRIAVSDRYLGGNGQLDAGGQARKALALRAQAHRRLAAWFGARPADGRRAEEEPWQWRQASDWRSLRRCLTDRAMFGATLRNRGEDELLGHWLVLEQSTRARIDAAYEAAWREWRPGRKDLENGFLPYALARFLERSGRYGAFTERMARLALVISKKVLGPTHPDTGECLNNLAGLLRAQGDYAAAEPLYRRAMAIAEKAAGKKSSDTLDAIHSLAMLLHDRGDYAAAEPLYRRALAIAEKALGPEHPETGRGLSNLAVQLAVQGEYAAAEPLSRRALAIAEKAHGPEHPTTGACLNNLAVLLRDRHDYQAAEPFSRRALKISEETNGPRHPRTGDSLNNLALILEAQGDYAAAEPLLRRALAIAEKAGGPQHPSTARCLNNLAAVLAELGQIDEAESLLRRELEIARARDGAESASLAISLQNLGVMLRNAGRVDEAAELLEDAVAIHRKIAATGTAPDTNAFTAALSALGQARLMQDRLPEAASLLEECLAIRTATLSPDDERIALVRTRLAEVRERMERSIASRQKAPKRR